MNATGGAVWTVTGPSLRITFQDSANCGGINDGIQEGTANRLICLLVPRRLSVHMTGRVEREAEGFDTAEVFVDGQLIASGGGTGEGLGCAMADITVDGSIDLAPGEHLIEIRSTTGDGQFHTGAFWNFQFTQVNL